MELQGFAASHDDPDGRASPGSEGTRSPEGVPTRTIGGGKDLAHL